MANWLERTPEAPMIALAGGLIAFPDADPAAALKALKSELSEPCRNERWLYAGKYFGPVAYKLTVDLSRSERVDYEANFLRLVQQVTGEANSHLGGQAE